MRSRVILDAGGIVAYLNSRDRYHSWAVAQFKTPGVLYSTCEPAVAEADHLLERANLRPGILPEFLRLGAVALNFQLSEHLAEIAKLQLTYRNVPMSLADAALVRMAELSEDSSIMTTDSDFKIYRKHRRHVIRLVTPYL